MLLLKILSMLLLKILKPSLCTGTEKKKRQTNTKNKFKISYYYEIKWEKNPQNVKPLQAQGRTTQKKIKEF